MKVTPFNIKIPALIKCTRSTLQSLGNYYSTYYQPYALVRVSTLGLNWSRLTLR